MTVFNIALGCKGVFGGIQIKQKSRNIGVFCLPISGHVGVDKGNRRVFSESLIKNDYIVVGGRL